MRCIQNIGNDVTHDSAAGMADMERPGGIGADKFHMCPLPLAKVVFAIVFTRSFDLLKELPPHLFFNEKVYKSRSGNLDFFEKMILSGYLRDNNFGNPSGIHLLQRCQHHRDIRGIITMAGVLGQSYLNRRQRHLGNHPPSSTILNRLMQQRS